MAGSTVMGSFDDFHAISDICQHYKLWHHVDACWGGFLAFGKNQDLFKGVNRADSLSFNPHKGFGVPLQSSYLLINNKPGLLRRAFSTGASYLFHESESQFDLGDKTIMCGRHNDALKVWLTFKRHGLSGLSKIADDALLQARYL